MNKIFVHTIGAWFRGNMLLFCLHSGHFSCSYCPIGLVSCISKWPHKSKACHSEATIATFTMSSCKRSLFTSLFLGTCTTLLAVPHHAIQCQMFATEKQMLASGGLSDVSAQDHQVIAMIVHHTSFPWKRSSIGFTLVSQVKSYFDHGTLTWIHCSHKAVLFSWLAFRDTHPIPSHPTHW